MTAEYAGQNDIDYGNRPGDTQEVLVEFSLVFRPFEKSCKHQAESPKK